MVLFKRKPVQFLPPAEIEDDNAEVWLIKETGEVFVSYEDYLNRMDFYKQRRFNDQITGQSGMTFFQAQKSELHGGREVEKAFPEALKGPILRKVQFQIVSRLDHLVDTLFEEFKQDYYPGEEVTVTLDGGERANGLVRDKTSFGPRVLADGTKSRPTTRYQVNIKDSINEITVTDEHICRERGAFTKAMLRSFLKRTTHREAWNGAPWLVRHEYAGCYQIDTRVPPHLRWDTVKEERRQLQAQKRAQSSHETNGVASEKSSPSRLPELKPAPKASKGKLSNRSTPNANKEPTPPPPPPPPKYPIDDLQLEPQGSVRPPLRFMCRDPPVTVDEPNHELHSDQIDMESVGPLLETWDTLNVYCEIFKLDSFTFDDFIEAMFSASESMPVQLFDEIHCSVLKILVDSERDGGKVRVTLPEIEEEDSDEENDEDEDEVQVATPEPEPKPRSTGRATRSSLAKLEAERLAAEVAAAEEEELRAELATKHRAEEALREYNWIEQLRNRNFAEGGWEMMIVGLLHQLSKNPRKEELCEELLLLLVPPNVEPSQETVRQAYSELDINYRVKILQMICMLTMETKAVRGYMEDCSETMTKYRKDKIDWQRQKKQALEELRQLNEQRKILLPDNMPPSPPLAPAKDEDDDSKMTDADTTLEVKDEDSIVGDDPKSRRKRRRTQSEHQRKREEEKERKEKEKAQKQAAAKLPAQSKDFIKLLKQIQEKEKVIKACEEEVAVIENDLREADCPRTRVLGKDRFWNRYYWFERNGMPYGGLPNSSTAAAEYANGCIWVQGPDEIEREGFIEVSKEYQDEYKTKFNMTVPERKLKEEGSTSVFNARQWGYISEPEQLEALIKWLDSRGINEMKLRKELVNYKDKIVSHMEKRKEYLAGTEEKEKKGENKRTSSRIREKTPEVHNYRCLQWENTMALEELGHLHSEPPPPPRVRKQTKKREAAAALAAAPPSKTRRR